jgi:DNA-binding IclR family transcriptional regulator/DNA-binding transcriptional ArsR family regulator
VPNYLNDTDKQILDLFLRQDPKQPALYVGKISEETGIRRNQVKRSVDKLVAASLVTQIGIVDKKHYYVATTMKSGEWVLPTSTRQQILDLLKKQDVESPWLTTKQIIAETKHPPGTVYHHLSELATSGEIGVEQVGKMKYFAYPSLATSEKLPQTQNERQQQILDVLRGQAEDNPWMTVKLIVAQTKLSPTIVYKSLQKLVADKTVKVVDANNCKYYSYTTLAQEEKLPNDDWNKCEQQVLDVLRDQAEDNPWMTVNQIVICIKQHPTTVRAHLRKLIAAKDVEVRKIGNQRYYAYATLANKRNFPRFWMECEQQILNLLRNQAADNPWMTVRQISTFIDRCPSTVYDNLENLVIAREISVEKTDRYNYYAHKSLARKETLPSHESSGEQILTLLRNQDENSPWLTIEAIIAHVKLYPRSVKRLLRTLITPGEIKVVQLGKRNYYAYSPLADKEKLPQVWNETQKKIVDELQNQDPVAPWMTTDQIAYQIKHRIGTVSSHLQELVAKRVIRVQQVNGMNCYALVSLLAETRGATNSTTGQS